MFDFRKENCEINIVTTSGAWANTFQPQFTFTAWSDFCAYLSKQFFLFLGIRTLELDAIGIECVRLYSQSNRDYFWFTFCQCKSMKKPKILVCIWAYILLAFSIKGGCRLTYHELCADAFEYPQCTRGLTVNITWSAFEIQWRSPQHFCFSI